MPAATLDVLVATFHELRTGRTAEGVALSKPDAVLSTAEAVNVAHAAALEAAYLDGGAITGAHVAADPGTQGHGLLLANRHAGSPGLPLLRRPGTAREAVLRRTRRSRLREAQARTPHVRTERARRPIHRNH